MQANWQLFNGWTKHHKWSRSYKQSEKNEPAKGDREITRLRTQLQTGSRTPLIWVPDQSIKLSYHLWIYRKSVCFTRRKELLTTGSYGKILSNTGATTKHILLKNFLPFQLWLLYYFFQVFPLFSYMKVVKYYAKRAKFCIFPFFPLLLYNNPHTIGDRSMPFIAITYHLNIQTRTSKSVY